MYPYRVSLLRRTQIDNGSADGRVLQCHQMCLGSAVNVIRKKDCTKGGMRQGNVVNGLWRCS